MAVARSPCPGFSAGPPPSVAGAMLSPRGAEGGGLLLSPDVILWLTRGACPRSHACPAVCRAPCALLHPPWPSSSHSTPLRSPGHLHSASPSIWATCTPVLCSDPPELSLTAEGLQGCSPWRMLPPAQGTASFLPLCYPLEGRRWRVEMCDGRRLLPVGRKGTAHGAHRAHGAHGAHSVHDGTEPMVPTEPTVPMDPTVARSPWRHGAHGAHGAHGSTEPTAARSPRSPRWHGCGWNGGTRPMAGPAAGVMSSPGGSHRDSGNWLLK